MKLNRNIFLTLSLAFVIFASGLVTGVFFSPMLRHFQKRPGPPPSPERIKSMMHNKICSELSLSDAQRKQAENAIEDWHKTMESLRKTHAPQYLAAFNAMFDKIAPMLSPEQLLKLNELRKEAEQRHFSFHEKNRTQRPHKKTKQE